MEYEFLALDKCAEEVEWPHHFLEDILNWFKSVLAICIYCDIKSAIEWA